MKKTSFIALALVVAVMLLGAGYAYWDDTLVINSTVDTGYLDVDFIEARLLSASPHVDTSVNNKIQALPGDGEDYPDGSLDNVIITLKNLYPGAVVKEKIIVKNKGTMPVKVGDLKVVGSGDNNVLDKMEVTAGAINYLAAEMDTMEIEPLHGGGEHNPPPKYLDPGKTLSYEITFKLKESAQNDITEYKTVSYTITQVFEQFNK